MVRRQAQVNSSPNLISKKPITKKRWLSPQCCQKKKKNYIWVFFSSFCCSLGVGIWLGLVWFFWFLETGSHYVPRLAPTSLSSGLDLQSARIIVMYHCTQLTYIKYIKKSVFQSKCLWKLTIHSRDITVVQKQFWKYFKV
jgi:hypothetical protein